MAIKMKLKKERWLPLFFFAEEFILLRAASAGIESHREY